MKFETLAVAALSYGGAATAAGAVQMMADQPPNIFAPALGGAAIAALYTISPIFKTTGRAKRWQIAFQAGVTLFAGFVLSYFCSDPINTMTTPQIGPLAPMGPLNVDPVMFAVIVGVAGEKILWLGWEAGPRGWLGWARSAMLGGKK